MDDRVHASRRRARHHLMLAIGLLVAAAFVLRFGVPGGLVQGVVVPWAVFLLVLYALGAGVWWAATARRHPRPDPWAYDPELDGPVAEAMEGQAFPPPAPRLAATPRSTALWVALAVVFLLAGAWLADVAGGVYRSANGAEGPSLSALALFVFAACFLAAGPLFLWLALRGPAFRARP